MSLEQALAENTATMKQLIAVLSSAVEAGGVSAPAGETAEGGDAGTTEGGKRKRRTKAEIEADNAAAAAAAGNASAATSTATPAVAQQSAASTATPTASNVSFDSIVEKLKAIHARDGNAGVKKVLDKFGVATVPMLSSKPLAEVDAAVDAVLNPAADASLFG